MNELCLFVRPPRPLWPFNGPGSAFWPPLAFASLAAALRRAFPELRVAILDAPALSMGWRTMSAEIRRLEPTYVGIGEEAVSCVEGLRLAALAKECGARVIAGGCFFSNVAAEVLSTGLVDVVVHGEGEQTIVELLPTLRCGDSCALRAVEGISFRDGDEVVFTGWRQPIADLDALPFPAYDLLPVECYGRSSHNHRALAAIELGRGCLHTCQFCVLWRQMARVHDGRPRPCLRTKSPERLLEEIRLLQDRFGRRYLGWVDPCFNADPLVPRQLAELLLRDGRRLGQSAWVRTDHLARDLASGAFGTCAASGLNELYLGIERLDRDGLRAIHKGTLNGGIHQVLRRLSAEFPQIFTVGSFIYGLPGDTPDALRALFRAAYELPLDLPLFIPLTPLPGTPYWRPDLWDATGESFRHFDFLPNSNGSAGLARLTATLYWCSFLVWPWERLRQLIRGPLARDARRRSIARRHLSRIMPFVITGMIQASLRGRAAHGMRFPSWYFD